MWCLTRTSHRKQLVILTTIISTSSQQKLSAGCLQTKWLWVRVQLQSLKGIYMIAGKHFTCMLKVVSKFSNSMFQPRAIVLSSLSHGPADAWLLIYSLGVLVVFPFCKTSHFLQNIISDWLGIYRSHRIKFNTSRKPACMRKSSKIWPMLFS